MLVMRDHGDMILKLNILPHRSALVAFHAFYSRFISTFEARIYVVVDCRSNFAADKIKKLHDIDSQLCPIATKATWVICLIKQSHR